MNELIARYRTDQMQKYQKDSELLDMADSLDFGSCWYDDYSIRLLSQGIMEFYTEDTLKRCSISMRQQAKLLVLKVEIIK